MTAVSIAELNKPGRGYWDAFKKKIQGEEEFQTSDNKSVIIDKQDNRWTAVSDPNSLKIFKKGNSILLPTKKPANGTIPLGKILKSNLKSSGVKVSDAAMTAMQELGTLWIFRQAIQNNKTFNRWQDIKSDSDTWSELVKIWTIIGKVMEGPDDEWLEVFYKQNEAFIKEMGKPDVTEFTRGSSHANNSKYTIPGSKTTDTFMDWISDWVKDNYGISQKDNWNPADIWLIKNEDKWKKAIKDACSYDGPKGTASAMVNLQQLNAILRDAYNKRQIIGVSLKKIGKGDTAVYTHVNTTEQFLAQRSDPGFKLQYSYDKAQCFLDTKTQGKNTVLATQDSRIVVKDGSTEYNFQIKANNSSDPKGSGLKYEATQKGAAAARLGKATVSLVVDLMGDYNLSFDTNKNSYPFSPEEFMNEIDDYKKKIAILKEKGVSLAKTGSINVEQCLDNLLLVFSVEPHVANSKCQQITWLSLIIGLNNNQRNNFLTDLVFLSKKEGRRYGPFGKIY